MTEQAPCHYPGCKRPAAQETEPLPTCLEHWHLMDALSDAEAWGLALGVLKPWVATSEAIGFERLTQVMEHALAEAEWEAAFARDELERAEAAAR